MMRMAICDNQKEDRALLVQLTKRYLRGAMLAVELFAYDRGEAMLEDFSKKGFSLCFLDIYMEGLDGVETARRIRKIDAACQIVFITVSTQHALDGYGVQAIEYLVKPITEIGVERALTRCLPVLADAARFIEIICEREMVKILLCAVRYAEVFDKRTVIHTEEREYTTWMALKEICGQLCDDPFLRCHRSFIVNLRYVDHAVANAFVLTDGARIPITTRDSASIHQRYRDFVFREAKERMYAAL